MAPLNDDETNRHVAVSDIGSRRNSWLSYFFNTDSNKINQRKIKTVSANEKDPHTESRINDIVHHTETFNNLTCACLDVGMNETKQSEDMRIQGESEIKRACTDNDIPFIQKLSSCKSCKIQQKKTNQISVYKKKDSDRVSKPSSFRAAVMDLSPEWFKSFLRDPEFVMEGGKRAEHNE